MKIAIYCGSSFGNTPIYENEIKKLIDFLSKKDVEIVYGGSNSGLMKVMSNHALSLGMKITGVITYDLANKEMENKNISKIYRVNTIRERKEKMEELADAFIAFPGGFGTIEEISEIFTSNQIGNLNKPCALFNFNNYYDKFFDFLSSCSKEGFLLQEHLDAIIVNDNIDEIYRGFIEYKPIRSKWEILSEK